ncbi:MAG: N-6 DNA methylase, partial [Nanoarchaeota archaeon]|nr:N-6 DNA methylase [Nanoarchaeota archaeon]
KEQVDAKKEFQIQSEFIDPLFNALGWDMRKEAEREEKVLKGRADYILRLGNQRKLVIEAKATDVRLEEKEGKQSVSYAYHKNIKFAVLTNFRQIRVYHALSNIKNIDKNLLKDDKGYLIFNCENFIEQFDRLWLLSKESFEKEEINKLLDNVDKRLIKPIDEAILTDLLQYREWLSKDLKNKRAYLEDSQIDEIVQILIDRLIFMRSVEDRKLEAEDFLLTIIKDVERGYTDMNLWAVLKSQFKRFDSTYNSKLFSEGILEKEGAFSNEILTKVIKGLYYGTQDNQERYMFDDIPVDLLGRIYEQYLGTILRGTEKRVKLDLVSGKRKKMGIYYTPKYIVDYILDNTLVEYAKDKTLDEILDIKVIDPACGSGSFLLDAFEELKKIIEKRLKNGEKSKSPQFNYFKERLDLGQKSAILTRCIYGVDLDEKAVELAQLNLLLKILEEETRETKKRILPNMKENIKNGNSLISDSNYDKAFNWNAHFPDVFRRGGFDIVIGNPPYVRVQELKHKDIDYFKENYKTAFRRIDISTLFFEKALSLIKFGGRIGFISSNQFLVSTYGEKLREILLENRIVNVVDFGDLPIFNDALTYTRVFIISKDKTKDFNYVKLVNILDFTNNNYGFDTINVSSLNSQSWSLGKKNVLEIINKLNSIKTKLNDMAKTNYGIITGNDKLLIFSEDKLKKLNFKKEFVRKIIVPQDIGRYRLNNPKENIIYPYIKKEESTKLEELENIKNKDSNLYQYLIKNKSDLELRKDSRGNFKGSSSWYGLVRFSKLNIFNQNKILTPSIVKKNKFCLDNNLYAFSGGKVTCITSDENLLVLLGILNSKLTEFYLHQTCPLKAGGYFNYSNTFLSRLPIKLPNEKQAKKIKELVERIMQFHKEGKSEQDIKNVDYEIDQEVYKLYEITEEEKEIIEESLR